MALSKTLANPLKISGLDLPPAVVLLCRLLALALLATNHQQQIQTPFLPFLPVFDVLPPELFQLLLRVALVAGCVACLLTRQVRIFAAVAGVAMLLAVASSRAYYGNNKTFTGLVLVLAALSRATGPARLIQWQMALVYGGAGLNKLLEPDWQSGQFFQYWAAERLQNPVYIAISRVLPDLAAGKFFCWYTIAAELTICALLLIPGRWRLTLWLSGALPVRPAALHRGPVQPVLLRHANRAAKPRRVAQPADCGHLGWLLRFLQEEQGVHRTPGFRPHL